MCILIKFAVQKRKRNNPIGHNRYQLFTTTPAQNFIQVTTMQNRHINVNMDKTISPTAELGISQVVAVPRAVVSLLKHANKQLATPPHHFTKIK
ncbi:hypothetical protein C6500_10455 [Candidatus Poribacteria bacterium]|nr:MAG: hypothetical protein C6500_10455 [Candidatus Poribacteria bacterium]